jgi:hypothetical protein
MLAGRANLSVYQGDDFRAAVTVSDSTGAAADLTGYTVNAQIRRGIADNNPDIVQTISTSVDLPNTINLSIDHADTANLTGPYLWDLQLTAADGTKTTILRGKVDVLREITVTP